MAFCAVIMWVLIIIHKVDHCFLSRQTYPIIAVFCHLLSWWWSSSGPSRRSHGGSSLEEGRIPRRHASIHASMDSQRSKQLLSQWKNKNDNRKLSLQVMDGVRPASASSPQGNIELRCSSEPSTMGLEAELRAGTHLPSATGLETELRVGTHIPAQYMKLAASSVPLANHNHLAHNGSTGLAGGARVSIQSRPGSSQLVHIPEEDNPTPRDQESESEDSIMDGGGSVREKWLRVAEKTTTPCRPLSAGGQPRLMQVNIILSCIILYYIIL